MEPSDGTAEVTLNKRGMPTRKRRRNSFYFNEDNVISGGDIQKQSGSKGKLKSVKQERKDLENSESDNAEDLYINEENLESMYGVGDILEISSDKVNPSVGEKSDKAGTENKKMKSSRRASEEYRQEKVPRAEKAEKVKKRYGTTGRVICVSPDICSFERSVSKKPKEESSVNPKRASKSRAPKSQPFENDPISKILPKEKSQGKIKAKPKPRKSNWNRAVKTSKYSRIIKEIVHNSGASSQSQDYYANGQEEQRRQEHRVHFYPPSISSAGNSNENRMIDYLPGFYPHPCLLEQSSPVSDIMEKSLGHELSLRIRNMLRLPKAHKWVCYEFFYSDIDRVLFQGENDFQIYLKDAFPGLKTRKCNKDVWCKIRQMMGKPRRCSQAFFDEEREVLARKRRKIRMIQQRRVTNFDPRELPDEIPLMLTIGTKVTARIRSPQDGIFSGTVGGVDTSNSSYRITFDRALIGTHSVPDYEVIATQPPEMVRTSSYVVKVPHGIYGNLNDSFKFHNSFLLSEGVFPGASQSQFPFNGMLGGFPIRFLIMIVRFSKMLKVKREKLFLLKELNSEAEKFLSYSKPYPKDFRIKYSRCILELETLNKQMDLCSSGIQQFCIGMPTGNKTTSSSTLISEDFRNNCEKETQALVMSFNNSGNANEKVQNPNTLSLIAKLGSLILQTQVLSLEDRTPPEVKSIKDTVTDIKASLLGSNVKYFQNHIEIPMNRIQAGLCVPSSKLT